MKLKVKQIFTVLHDSVLYDCIPQIIMPAVYRDMKYNIINTGHMVPLIGFYIKLFIEKNANSGQFYTGYLDIVLGSTFNQY